MFISLAPFFDSNIVCNFFETVVNELSEFFRYFSIYVVHLFFVYSTFLFKFFNLWARALFGFSVIITHIYGARYLLERPWGETSGNYLEKYVVINRTWGLKKS